MTDIGFGMIDRRTVVVVLFSMVIAQVLFGLKIPVDTTNVGSLFIDVVLLTGYLYLARSAYRLPMALLSSLIVVIREAKDSVKERIEEIQQDEHQSNKSNKRLKAQFKWALLLILTPLFFILGLFFLTFTFGEWSEGGVNKTLFYLPRPIQDFYYSYHRIVDIAFGMLDRIGLICIAVAATMPSFNYLVKGIGIGGLLIMGVVFTFRGDFTALVKDLIEKKKEDKKESEPAVEIKNSPSSPMYVKVMNDKESPIEIKNSEYMPLSDYLTHRSQKVFE